jgi:hypothetical protein
MNGYPPSCIAVVAKINTTNPQWFLILVSVAYARAPGLIEEIVPTSGRFIADSLPPGKVRTGRGVPYRLQSSFSNFTEPRP